MKGRALDAAVVGEKGVPTALRGRIGRIQRADRDRPPAADAWRPALENAAPAFGLRAADFDVERTWTDSDQLAHIRYRLRKHGLEVVGASLSLHADEAGEVYAAFGNVRDDQAAPRPAHAKVSADQARAVALDGKEDLKADEPRLVYVITTRDQELHLAWEVQIYGIDAGAEVAEKVFVSAVSGQAVDRHSQICDARYREVFKLNYSSAPPDSSSAPGYQPLPGWPYVLWKDEQEHTAPEDPSKPGYTLYQTTYPAVPTAMNNSHWDILGKAYDFFKYAHGRDSYDNTGGSIRSILNADYYVGANGAGWSGFSKELGFGAGYKAAILEFRVLSNGQNVAQGKSVAASSFESDQWQREPFRTVDGNVNTGWVANGNLGGTASIEQVFPQWLRVDLGSTYNLQSIEINWFVVNGWRFRLEVSNDNVNWSVVQGTTTATIDGSTWTTIPDTTTNTAAFVTSRTSFASTGRRYARVVITGTLYGAFGLDHDIVTHEFAHGVTQHTSGLIYGYEPGALNEAFSDIMAAAAQWWREGNSAAPSADVWRLGETAYTPGLAGDATRYLNDPALGGQPDYFPERYTGTNDRGGVHINSGIANLAFYLVAHGGSHPRGKTSVIVPPAHPTKPELSMEYAQKIFYRAFTTYLGVGARLADARIATVTAAQTLYGSQVATNVHLAWDAVGVPASAENNYPVNMSTRADVGTGDSITIAGFVLGPSGSAKPMLLRGVGPTLANFGVSGAMTDPELRLFRRNGSTWEQVPVNGVHDDWGSQLAGYPSPSAVAQAAVTTGAFALPSGSKDAAFLPTLSPGIYSLQLSGKSGGTGQAMVEFYDTAPDPVNANHLVNLSTRCRVTGSAPAIGGFVINGSAHKCMLIRAVGPTLGSFGVSGTLSDPRLKITLPDGTLIYQSDNWYSQDSTLASATEQVGAFSLTAGSKDAAMVVLLPPGIYTAVAESVDGSTGICLVELYEVGGFQ